MKNCGSSILIAMFIWFASCNTEVSNECSVLATVKDLSGFDGCGFVFELSDGSYLEPRQLFWCGTPPQADAPKNVLEDFEFVDGKVVSIGYEVIPDAATYCMVGKVVRITCIDERMFHQEE